MTKPRLSRDYLDDILLASGKAAEFLGNMSLETFSSDDKTVYVVIRALKVVGETARRITQEMRERYPEVPWRAMAGIRDKLIHDYISVNIEVVWKTVLEDLPPLRPMIQRILDASP